MLIALTTCSDSLFGPAAPTGLRPEERSTISISVKGQHLSATSFDGTGCCFWLLFAAPADEFMRFFFLEATSKWSLSRNMCIARRDFQVAALSSTQWGESRMT